MKKGIFALLVAVLGCGAANAGTVVCSGTVAGISIHGPDIMIRLSSMNQAVTFCRLDSTFTVAGGIYPTSPEMCKALVAMFIAARESGRTIESVYFDGDSVPATCNGWANWSNANIRYFIY
jgi:hypothetical protein